MNTKEKGITLIALVVTIIILLILAGVTLNMALSGDGLFSRARNAADSYKKAQDDEGKLMENLVDEMDKLSPKKAGTTVEVPKGENWEEDKVTPVADGKGSAVPIPKGFYYVGGNIDTGIVISDVENDDLNNSKHGNQFVWIPCTAGEYESAKDDVIENDWPCKDEYKENISDTDKGWSDNYTESDNTKIKSTYGAIADVIEGWENNQSEVAIKSLEKYKGFYVARFEAGIPKEANDFFTNTEGEYKGIGGQKTSVDVDGVGRGKSDESSSIKGLKPVSQKNMQAWNLITQPNAKMVAENMYKNDLKEVNSYLIDSSAWNVICNKFNKILGNKESGRTVKDSRNFGNYENNITTDYSKINALWALHTLKKGNWTDVQNYKNGNINKDELKKGYAENEEIELSTGASDDFEVYNIFDMAGNMWEWTTEHIEKDDEIYVVGRGGSFDNNGEERPVTYTGGTNTMSDFRMASWL